MIWFILCMISLLAIIYEDFRYRAIHFYWVILLTIGSIGQHYIIVNSIQFTFIYLNTIFLLSMLLGLQIYFSLKNGCWITLADQYLGWGDILFFIPLIFLFSPINFLIFFILSLLFSLLFAIPLHFIKNQNQTIPLAACMSIILLPIQFLHFTSYIKPYNDTYWLFII